MLPTALIISLLIACNETTDPEVTEAAAVETVSPESQRKEALKTIMFAKKITLPKILQLVFP